MSTFIYISGQQLQIVVGQGTGAKAKVSKAFRLMAPEGSVINGTIMDVEAFAPFIKNFFTENKLPLKDVNLVLNSRKIVGKTLEVPPLSPAKTLEFVSREFSELDREEGEGVFCYTTLSHGSKDKLKRIYAETMSRDFVKEFMDIFGANGIQLSGIYSSEGAVIKLVELSAAELRQTFVVQIADDNLLTNVLWVDGSFYYYSSQRCFQEIGSEEYFGECVRMLNQIGQFMRANQINSQIETIYVGGMSHRDAEEYRHYVLNSEVEASVDVFSCGLPSITALGEEAQEMLMAISGLVGQEKTNNMLTNYRERKADADAPMKSQVFLVGGVLAFMLVLLIGALAFKFSTDHRLEATEEANTDPMLQADLMDYELYSFQQEAATNKLRSMMTIEEQIATYPALSSDVIKELEKTAGDYAQITIQSFDAPSGEIRFTVSAKEVDDINKYIAEMMKLDTFTKVDYTGYSYDDKDALWDVHVSCIMAEGEGR